MRTLFVSNLYPPGVVGGYERLCADVAREFVARGHAVTVLTGTYGQAVARWPGQVVHQALQLLIGGSVYAPYCGSVDQRAALNRANRTAASRVIAEAQPDAIFCWNLYALDESLVDTLLESGVPVVLMLTDNWLITMKNPDFIDAYFQANVFRRTGVMASSNGIATPAAVPCSAIFGSAFMRDLHRQAGVTIARSVVVHNGVRQTVPASTGYAERSGFVDGLEFSLLFAGRLVELKGLHTAVEALALLPDGAVRLTIVGDSQDQAYLDRVKSSAQRLGVLDRISFRPAVAEDDLFALFQQFDAYVFPSLYEPFSLTLILALAAGIPTAASRVGGNTEIVQDDQTGLLFEREDAAGLAAAIARLAADSALRCRLSERSREAAKHYTFASMVDGMEHFIGKVARPIMVE